MVRLIDHMELLNSEKGDAEKGTFVQKLLCIPHEEYFTKRSLRLKKADG